MTADAPDTPTGWKAVVYFWDGGWMGVGRGTGVVPPHAHHAVQISLGLDHELRVRGEDEEWITSPGGAILPNQVHSFDPADQDVAMIFVDPECREGRWLRHSAPSPVMPIAAERYEAFRASLKSISTTRPSEQEATALVTGVVRAMCAGPMPQRPVDERILKALTFMRANDARKLSLAQVAGEVFLSPSRLAHLFTEELGLPFRRYLLWRKVNRAMDEFGNGGTTLSGAAHAAGFSDAAHLTRTFYQMFGLSPSRMMGSAEFYKIPAPFDL